MDDVATSARLQRIAGSLLAIVGGIGVIAAIALLITALVAVAHGGLFGTLALVTLPILVVPLLLSRSS